MKKSQKSKNSIGIAKAFINSICGYWKRSVEVRELGGIFQHLSTRNEILKIEEVRRKETVKDVRYIRWSFGKTLKPQDMQFAYEMKLKIGTEPLEMKWKQDGIPCEGLFYPSTKTAILQFNTKKTFATVTYSFLNQDRMSVVILEINKNEKNKRNLQYGNLYKINKSIEIS